MADVWLFCTVPVFLSFVKAEKPEQHMNIHSFGTLCPRSHYFYLVRPRHGQWECRCSTLERPPQLVWWQGAYVQWQHKQLSSKVTIVRQALQKIICLFPHALCLSIFVRTFIAIMQHNIMHPQENTEHSNLPTAFHLYTRNPLLQLQKAPKH